MIDIAQIVREAGWSGIYTTYKKPAGIEAMESSLEHLTVPVTREQIERFATLYRESLIAELIAGGGEPAAWSYWQSSLNDDGTQTAPWVHRFSKFKPTESVINRDITPLYTADQLAVAVLRKERHMLEFLADAELREKWKQFQAGAAIRSGT